MSKKVKTKKRNKANKFIVPAVVLSLIVFGPLFLLWFKHFVSPDDKWCTTSHITSLAKVNEPKTSQDYFNLGNYDFESGDCGAAITAYTKSIQLDPKSAESYNNRGYTYMRMADYGDALPDLKLALIIRPNYVNALMNRGDIYNYYLSNRAKALSDYQKVIDLGGVNGTSVCGHMLMARDNGSILQTIVDHITAVITHLGNIRQAGC